jgi:hypothetical protein
MLGSQVLSWFSYFFVSVLQKAFFRRLARPASSAHPARAHLDSSFWGFVLLALATQFELMTWLLGSEL